MEFVIKRILYSKEIQNGGDILYKKERQFRTHENSIYRHYTIVFLKTLPSINYFDIGLDISRLDHSLKGTFHLLFPRRHHSYKIFPFQKASLHHNSWKAITLIPQGINHSIFQSPSITINSRRNPHYCRISISPNNHLIVGSSYMLYEGFLARWQTTKINVFVCC